MANEFGEDPSIYVWPRDHVDGEPFPEDFYQKVTKGLRSVGIEWEPT